MLPVAEGHNISSPRNLSHMRLYSHSPCNDDHIYNTDHAYETRIHATEMASCQGAERSADNSSTAAKCTIVGVANAAWASSARGGLSG